MKKLMAHYGNNSYKALCEVYPEISFDPGKFTVRRGKKKQTKEKIEMINNKIYRQVLG